MKNAQGDAKGFTEIRRGPNVAGPYDQRAPVSVTPLSGVSFFGGHDSTYIAVVLPFSLPAYQSGSVIARKASGKAPNHQSQTPLSRGLTSLTHPSGQRLTTLRPQKMRELGNGPIRMENG